MVFMIGGAGLFLALLVGFNVFKGVMIKRALAGAPEPPETVTTTEVRFSEWQPVLSAVGTVRALHGADLAFEVPGVVARIDAAPGSEVKQGQPLVALNDDAEVAQLRQLKAQADLAEVTARRAKAQVEANTISAADFDAVAADFKAKAAAVQSQAAMVARKHLTAPFPGRVGLVNTSPGAYLNPGSPVVTLQQLDHVFVDFSLPQKTLGQIHKGQKCSVTLDAYPDRTFTGQITAVNPKVDGSTRNVQVEATFANPGSLLVPGMFANVSLEVGTLEKALTLPQTAVTYNPYGTVVFLAAKAAGKTGLAAQQVFVTTGSTRGDQVAILKGLTDGAQVVTSGSLKLRNGTPLLVDNKVLPASEAHPQPQEQ
jgi:membrane fusion protein (multidrug efflux system)